MIIVGLDLETTGLHPIKDYPQVVSLKVDDAEPEVYDWETGLAKIKYYNSLGALFILHSASFDCQFILRHVFLENIYDTYVSEIIITNGIRQFRSLEALCQKYLGVKILKDETQISFGKKFIFSNITQRQKEYCFDDVRYLKPIREKQLEIAKKLDLISSINLQNLYIKENAILQSNGIPFNSNIWLKRYEVNVAKCKAIQEELDDCVRNEPKLKKFVDTQIDLFESKSKVNLNYNSQQQIIKAFKLLGVPVPVSRDRETVGKKELAKVKGYPFVEKYKEFKEFQKDLSTYGLNFLDYVHEGRIYSVFHPYQNTGRLSSGDSKNGFPNLQNLPKDALTRSAFEAPDGWDIIATDYTNQEAFYCAEATKDPILFAICNDGLDSHSITATAISSIFCGKTIDVEKDKHAKTPNGLSLRGLGKTVNFALQYLAKAPTIANDLNIPIDLAKKIHAATVEKYKIRHQSFENTFLEALRKGYVQFNSITKSKYFIPDWEKWNKYMIDNNIMYNPKTREFIVSYDLEGRRDFLYYIDELRKIAANYPIQGTCSEISKYAIVLINRELRKKGLDKLAFIVNFAHDEFVYQSRKDATKEVKEIIERNAITAADKFMKILKLRVVSEVGKCWIH